MTATEHAGCCECGSPKEPRATACSRCTHLDGARAAGRVISGLRALGGRATNDALQVELGIGRTGVLRAIGSLITSGRVAQIKLDIAHGTNTRRAPTIYELRCAP